jgi:hypothetical protein
MPDPFHIADKPVSDASKVIIGRDLVKLEHLRHRPNIKDTVPELPSFTETGNTLAGQAPHVPSREGSELPEIPEIDPLA